MPSSHGFPRMHTGKLKYREITDKIIKGFYDVYNELGRGFLESVYEEAFYIVLTGYGLRVEKQKNIEVYFRGHLIGTFRADLVVEDKIIVEIKAVNQLSPVHEAQLINYLKATSIEVGLVMNFGDQPEFKRLIFNKKSVPIRANPWQQTEGGENFTD